MSLETFPHPSELRGAVYGTILYLALYVFVFLQFQSYSKFYLYFQQKKQQPHAKVSLRAIKYYNSQDIWALTGDRTVGNFLEQSIVFLPLLWLHAIFIDPTQSWTICILYTITRCYYPVAFYTQTMYWSTIPGYIILIYLFQQLIYQL
jgi:MAPEG family